MHSQCDVPEGMDNNPGESDEMFLHPRILTLPYQVILTLGNSDIEFCNKSVDIRE